MQCLLAIKRIILTIADVLQINYKGLINLKKRISQPKFAFWTVPLANEYVLFIIER